MSSRILVVDDDDAHRGMLRMMLRSWGYEVDEADDGEAPWRPCAPSPTMPC